MFKSNHCHFKSIYGLPTKLNLQTHQLKLIFFPFQVYWEVWANKRIFKNIIWIEFIAICCHCSTFTCVIFVIVKSNKIYFFPSWLIGDWMPGSKIMKIKLICWKQKYKEHFLMNNSMLPDMRRHGCPKIIARKRVYVRNITLLIDWTIILEQSVQKKSYMFVTKLSLFL